MAFGQEEGFLRREELTSDTSRHMFKEDLTQQPVWGTDAKVWDIHSTEPETAKPDPTDVLPPAKSHRPDLYKQTIHMTQKQMFKYQV